MTWQPIETAPEGQWVLVADRRVSSDGLRLYVARAEAWHYEGQSGVNYDGPYADGYLCDLSDISVEPTHWMPLPKPPEKESGMKRPDLKAKATDARRAESSRHLLPNKNVSDASGMEARQGGNEVPCEARQPDGEAGTP